MREGTFAVEMEVELDVEEKRLRGETLARLVAQLGKHQKKMKEEKAALAKKEKDYDEAITEASRAIETGKERRWVECRERLRGSLVTVCRVDTGEIVESRPAGREDHDQNDDENPPRVPH